MTELDRRVEELAAEQLGVFTTQQVLLRNGTSDAVRTRLRSGRWVRGDYEVLRLLGTPGGRTTRLMSFVVASGFRAVVSHRCAADLHGLPGFDHEHDEFTLPFGVNFGRNTDIEVHRSTLIPTHHVVSIGGLHTMSLARVLLELTAVVRLGRAARAMDTALARRHVSYWSCLKMLEDLAVRGRRRTRIFRMLLEERGPHYRPPESELEKRFDLMAVQLGLAGWERQVNLGDDLGWIGRVDFYRREDRLVLELDGREAHSSFMDTKADIERDRRFRAAGFRVLRFGWAQVVHDSANVVAVESCTCLTLDRTIFCECLDTMPVLARNLAHPGGS
ncbi:MAG: DUF559 domain-containing protein, partial [Acidimicrobiia bacterium]